MFQRRQRRFRRRPNGRNHLSNSGSPARLRLNSFSNDQTKHNFRTSGSAEKLLEKYNVLAKEALSSGDKTLAENYFQHADHFMRIVETKNKLRNQSKDDAIFKSATDEKNLSEKVDTNQDSAVKNKE